MQIQSTCSNPGKLFGESVHVLLLLSSCSPPVLLRLWAWHCLVRKGSKARPRAAKSSVRLHCASLEVEWGSAERGATGPIRKASGKVKEVLCRSGPARACSSAAYFPSHGLESEPASRVRYLTSLGANLCMRGGTQLENRPNFQRAQFQSDRAIAWRALRPGVVRRPDLGLPAVPVAAGCDGLKARAIIGPTVTGAIRLTGG